jgi:FkbM family methyltransferase
MTIRNQLMKNYLRIPYATSLLPSSLLARGILSDGLMSRICKTVALLSYGLEKKTKDLLKTDSNLRSACELGTPQGQMLQDAWVVSHTGTSPGYFLDIGACHPKKYSNTWLLQHRYNWSGLLIEANDGLAAILKADRSSNNVRVIEAAAGEVASEEMLIEYGPLSSLQRTAQSDIYAKYRSKRNISQNLRTVSVRTIAEILETESVPKCIEFLSIDIEGADLEVLKAFPFAKYEVRMICIEHNFNDTVQSGITDYLSSIGYIQECKKWSSIDSWFVRTS